MGSLTTGGDYEGCRKVNNIVLVHLWRISDILEH